MPNDSSPPLDSPTEVSTVIVTESSMSSTLSSMCSIVSVHDEQAVGPGSPLMNSLHTPMPSTYTFTACPDQAPILMKSIEISSWSCGNAESS